MYMQHARVCLHAHRECNTGAPLEVYSHATSRAFDEHTAESTSVTCLRTSFDVDTVYG